MNVIKQQRPRREEMARVTKESILRKFVITKDDMEKVSNRLRKDFEEGLSKDDHKSCVKMLITFVHSLPDGSEEGDFLALDLGGSNFRVLLINIKDRQITQEVKKSQLTKDLITQTQEVLFDHIASEVATFVKEKKIQETLPLGFTFSFPVKQNSLTSGVLLHWTKDFKSTGAVGEDVCQLLREAIQRRPNDVDIDVVALVNDTTGTQMALGIDDPECYIGLILGTGTNACYLEQLDNVKKFPGNSGDHKEVIINTEWGAFGEDGSIDEYITPFDEALNAFSENKKQQQYEKMISGKYLGEIVRQVCLKLIDSGLFLEGQPSGNFKKQEAFKTSYVSDIENGEESNLLDAKRVLKDEMGIDNPTEEDCRTIREVCTAVSIRAARLAAAGVVSLVRKIGKVKKCTVAVDGSLYKCHPHFKFIMKASMEEMEPGNGITMKESQDGSGKGAAMVAAVATRLAAKK